jgi:hypothetical protein
MGQRRSPPGVQDRRPCSRSARSCCSWKRCDVTQRRCRTVTPDGSPVCASLTWGGRWRCCTATSRGVGQSMIWVARSDCRALRWLTVSFVSSGTANALPHQLANAGRNAKASYHERVPCTDCRNSRLRLRGRILPRFQERIRHGASHVATFQQLDVFPQRSAFRQLSGRQSASRKSEDASSIRFHWYGNCSGDTMWRKPLRSRRMPNQH